MTIFATDQYAIQAILRSTIFSPLTTSADEVYTSSHISVLLMHSKHWKHILFQYNEIINNSKQSTDDSIISTAIAVTS